MISSSRTAGPRGSRRARARLARAGVWPPRLCSRAAELSRLDQRLDRGLRDAGYGRSRREIRTNVSDASRPTRPPKDRRTKSARPSSGASYSNIALGATTCRTASLRCYISPTQTVQARGSLEFGARPLQGQTPSTSRFWRKFMGETAPTSLRRSSPPSAAQTMRPSCWSTASWTHRSRSRTARTIEPGAGKQRAVGGASSWTKKTTTSSTRPTHVQIGQGRRVEFVEARDHRLRDSSKAAGPD